MNRTDGMAVPPESIPPKCDLCGDAANVAHASASGGTTNVNHLCVACLGTVLPPTSLSHGFMSAMRSRSEHSWVEIAALLNVLATCGPPTGAMTTDQLRGVALDLGRLRTQIDGVVPSVIQEFIEKYSPEPNHKATSRSEAK